MIYVAYFLSFSVGFLSMSQEILWVRLCGFIYQGYPQVFSFVLTMILAGISLGAFIGKKICFRIKKIPPLFVAILCLIGIFDLVILKLISLFLLHLDHLGIALIIILSSASKGVIFPIVHHLGVKQGLQLGKSISYVYLLNILGSTMGPLVFGLYVLDILPITACFKLLAICSISLAFLGIVYLVQAHHILKIISLILILISIIFCTNNFIHTDDHSLVLNVMSDQNSQVLKIIENRHGIIHTIKGKFENDDIIFGGNVYDGRTNLDLRNNSNLIDRAFLLHILHPNPRHILSIGLSGGVWARVLLSNPAVVEADIVEINPGYIELIKNYKHLAPLLEDKRTVVHIDDGRRWLRNHLQNKFDLIVMNTTFHWRANSTNLLSKEFFELVRTHLNEGGIFAFNATGSDDAFFTAAHIFAYSYRYRNFIYCSQINFNKGLDSAKTRLYSLQLDGIPIFKKESIKDLETINKVLSIPFETIEDVKRLSPRKLEIITDQNMLTEFKNGRQFY